MNQGAKRYLRYLENGNRSAATVQDYGRTFARFFERFDALGTDNVDEFLAGHAPGTRNKYRIQLFGLAKFLKQTEAVDWDQIPIPKLSVEPPVILRPEHNAKIYEWLLRFDRRHKTVYAVAYRFIMHTALRIGELETLRPENVDTDRNGMPFLRVSKASGRSHSKDGRVIPLDRAARRIVERYGLPLPVKGRSFNRVLRQACRACRIRTDYSAHNLRKSCLSRWHERGMDIKTIADIAGHSSTDTLLHYLDRSPEALRRKMGVCLK